MGKLKGNAKGTTRDRIKNKIRAQLKASSKVKKHLKTLCIRPSGHIFNSNEGLKAVLLLLSLWSFANINAQWRIVLDPKAVAQVEANTILQMATENAHNAQLDTILSKQEEIRDKTLSIAAAKELTLQTLNNIEGFGVESMYYKLIAKTSKQIVDISPQILTSLKDSGIENKALVTMKVSDLVGQATQCVNDFVSIVNNSKVSNPLVKSSGKDDGHNLLDRYERMTLACQIYGDLLNIKRQLNYMLSMCEYGNWADLIKAIDHRTWANMAAGKMISDNLINQWNKSVKR